MGFRCSSRQVGAYRVLLVGAGGIGSEVLKTLVLTGFRQITLVDLDTIDTSNLNRQFLFRSSHVGSSKATVAAEAMEQFLPVLTREDFSFEHPRKKPRASLHGNGTNSVSASKKRRYKREGTLHLQPYCADIKDGMFSVSFFKNFDVVLNGLDNLNARRHVNRLCLAADVPLVESGTTGYEGSVTVHIRDVSHCYECEQKPVQKSFPICTIRNTPEKLIHCIVWAKDLLFNRVFGETDVMTDLDEQRNEKTANDTSTSYFIRQQGETAEAYAVRVFERVFDHDIRSVLDMKELWTKRVPPKPIPWTFQSSEQLSSNGRSPVDPYKVTGPVVCKRDGNCFQVLSVSENACLFVNSICAMHEERAADIGHLTFDKDDDIAVQFVTAASNLRAKCYSIQPSSLFEIKGMAGNIIHAIATTNAIVAGLIVTEACKILCGCMQNTKESFVGKHRLFHSSRKRDVLVKCLAPPAKNPACVTCGKSMLEVTLNTETMTLGDFVEKVIKTALGITTPNLVCGSFMYEEGEGLEDDEKEEYEALLSRPLNKLPGTALVNGSILDVQDQTQLFSCKIVILHEESMDQDEYPDQFILKGAIEENEEKQKMKRKRDGTSAEASVVDVDDEVVILSDDGYEEDGEIVETVTKKPRWESESAE